MLSNEFFKALKDYPKWFQKPAEYKRIVKYQWQSTKKKTQALQ